MKNDILTETLFLKKKDKNYQKKLGFKFIRINTSNVKNGYDLDYEVGNIEAFIDELKNQKIKKLEKQLIKEKEIREKVEKEMGEKLEKELKDKSKELKNLRIIIKNVKDEKHKIKNKTNRNWKTTWNNILFWVKRLYEEFQAMRSENDK